MMNVRNRIKRLEIKLGFTAGYCECFNEHRRKLIESVYDNTPYEEKDGYLPEGDYCHKCKKPVNVELEEKMSRTIELINTLYDETDINL